MAISGDACWLFGGSNGNSATDSLLHIDLQPVLQLQHSSIADLAQSMACCGAVDITSCTTADGADARAAGSTAATAEGASVGAAALRAFNKAAAPPPLRLADLPNAD
jgi:hypothetical protein